MSADLKPEVLIIGGGPAGSTTAMRLIDLGVRPLIIEREQFPRYHIGESMTGECGGLMRDLGLGDRMLEVGHPIKYGVSVYGSRGNKDWWVPVMQRLPDGSMKEQFTWQVRRSDFDAMMLDEAIARGAEKVDARATAPLMGDDGEVRGVTATTPDDRTIEIETPLTLDCTGQASFLANKKATGPKYLGAYDKQIAVFSQITNFIRDNGEERENKPDNTHIFYTKKYHWAWAIPIDDQVTSVGIVIPAEYFREKGESKIDFVRRELNDLNAGLSNRIDGAPVFVEEAHVIPNYSFQVRKFAGPGYMCVGDSHRFIDPIFSFGLYVAIKEAGLAANAAVKYLAGEGRGSDDPFHDYMITVETAVDRIEDLVDAFWENPLAFAVMTHKKFRNGTIDNLAGRFYDDHGCPMEERDQATAAFRKLLGRERVYDDTGLYSMPIGSRFHPERAPLWNSNLDSVETTEAWMRALD